MHEFTGKIANIAVSFATGKPLLTLELNEDRQTLLEICEELKSSEWLRIKVGKFSRKRSLDANAYCWVLISKLAEKLDISKTDIYRAAIREIGGNSDIVCIQDKAVQSLCDGWTRNGLGWMTETFESKIEGCTNVVLYYGSSTYDSKQMNRLINFVVEACRSQGIETRSDEELSSLLDHWRRNYG